MADIRSTKKRRIELELNYVDKKRKEVVDLENQYRLKMEKLTKLLEETEDDSSDHDEDILDNPNSDLDSEMSQNGDGKEKNK